MDSSKNTLNKLKIFIMNTLALFISHTWQIIAIICVTALLVSLIVTPITVCISAGNRAAITSQSKKEVSDQDDDPFANIESWEEGAREFLSSCEVVRVEVQDIHVENYDSTSLLVFTDHISSFDNFFLSTTLLAYLFTTPPAGLKPLDYIYVYSPDCVLTLSHNEKSMIPRFYSMLTIDESCQQYEKIKKSYDKYYDSYKIDLT